MLPLCVLIGVPREFGTSEAANAGTGLILSSGNALGTGKTEDPCVFAIAYKKDRFYWFSRREPADDTSAGVGRDVFNEKPSRDAAHVVAATSAVQKSSNVVIHTTMGDITLSLHPEETPKTCENFLTHAKNGYYNGVVFHRIIKEFMIQTGDPKVNNILRFCESLVCVTIFGFANVFHFCNGSLFMCLVLFICFLRKI